MSDTLEITKNDIAYLQHDDVPLMLRLRRPPGPGPFPVVVDLHGGAWTKGALSECDGRDEVLVRAGLATAALDFRHADAGYPTSSVDINFAIRWLKAQSGRLRLDPARVAITGQSSGGHLAMLAAMRPLEPRYAAIPLPDGTSPHTAHVRCVGMTWPVINPYSRYRHALRLRGSDAPPAWTATIPERHDLYWGGEAAMIEGNPLLALERQENVETPPALWIQGREDEIHNYRDPDAELDLNEPERFAQR
ncbi:MAG: alpha/beta hydrolase, partial [Rhodospirillaceae bacterium]|nr:alpha/beta hydrolase [Rhodospirillaceae bacterium]